MILDIPQDMAIERLMKYRKNSSWPVKAHLLDLAKIAKMSGIVPSLPAMQEWADSREDHQWRGTS